MADERIDVGDKVQWNYGAGHPQGVAAEIKTQPGEKVQIQSQKGNTVSRNADEENPAVRVERQGDGNNQDVVKRMSELTKVGEGKGGEEKKEAGVGEKRERDSESTEKHDSKAEKVVGEAGVETAADSENKDKEPEAKKTKLDGQGETTTKEKSTRGRGRGRGKAAATTTAPNSTRRTGGRTKKTSTESQEKSKEKPTSTTTATSSGEGDKVDGVSGKVDEVVMSDAIPEVDGENEEGAKVKAGEMPSEHTRSKEVQASAHN